MVTSNDPARPIGTGLGGDGGRRADADAARRGPDRGVDRSTDRNAELDTVEHDLRDLRR